MQSVTKKSGTALRLIRPQPPIATHALGQTESRSAGSAENVGTYQPRFRLQAIGVNAGRQSTSRHAGAAHTNNALYRVAAGPTPNEVPPIVHEVIKHTGQPIPSGVRQDMERLFGHNFSDVRVHTDSRAGTSAAAVAANAYTVGRHIVFAPGHYNPASAKGRQLLVHELTHAAAHPANKPTPSGKLRISSPHEPAEQHASAVSTGAAGMAGQPAAAQALFRQAGALVGLNGVSVNHDRITVPPAAGLTFTATKSPANASGVTLSVVGDNATIDAGTTINNTTGAITVAATQTGGSAHIAANQNATAPDGSTMVSTAPATAPFNFNAVPTGIASTSASARGVSGFYGGDFIHTFSGPGGASTLERSHVNEHFAAASGTTLNLNGLLGSMAITVNNASAATAGWDLDSSGTMLAADHVTWSDTVSARPFVANASNPTPAQTLPQALTATQSFRNLNFPGQTYGATAVATTTHRRAIEDRNNLLKAVTSANATGISQEVVEDYAGPTVFRRCAASPVSIPVSMPAAPGTTPAPAATATITVDAEGQSATPAFSFVGANLGCTISATGILTPGTTPGTVTIRAGNSVNYDQVAVTLTAPVAVPAPNPNPNPNPTP